MHVKSLEMAPGLANARSPGSTKFANAPLPGLGGGGGGVGWAQLELTDASLKAVSILRVCLTLRENMRRPPLFALDQCDFPEVVHQAHL